MTDLFLRLRRQGFSLGVGEYLAALRAIDGGFADSTDALEQTLRILWCRSLTEQSEFEPIWQAVASATTQELAPPPPPPLPKTPEPINQPDPLPPAALVPLPAEERSSPDLVPLPVRAPFTPIDSKDSTELQTYYPLSRRSMIYNWRYLRRPVADGIPDVLDIQATVERAARQGFFLAPIYRRRERNDARLILFVDQNGSMMPLHRFTRDLVETAQFESSLPQAMVFYFHNTPADSVYRDVYLTKKVPLPQVLANCDSDTSVLIVSNAGAARGYRRLERIQATVEFLFHLKQYTTLVAWLNPMSIERWIGSSAEIIATLVKMYPMDNDGLSQAIDIIRGQSLHSHTASLL
ncbi:VWA containing CoxE family protein [Leptolyngbya sp. FACHB-321]|uniref:VWA containing CoxE family protein n=1 Tax=Leptolyngbya sp. FACHB-321 TaxID=2692807 RepID=UPI00168619C1|nr:VWA containing CoxE family protein [Leptolyngbya sp. FACHB-321]MBD2033830.1 VWA containing CoxE family protein [Leptolyngbya sp. FACHB-321]